MRLRIAAVALAAVAVGCAGEAPVPRVVEGRVVLGDFVTPEAYAAFLAGVIAEERGDVHEALVQYGHALSDGQSDAEIWTRIGALRCRVSPTDPEAQTAMVRALTLDAAYAPAWEASARCALLRGEPARAADDAVRALLLDATAVGPELLLASLEGQATGARAFGERQRLVALTLADASAPAWDALAAWGRGHHDAALVAAAMAHVAVMAPERRAEVGKVALALAGEGELGAARALAGAVVDAPGDRSSGGLGPSAAADPLVARLAIDEALLARDRDRAMRRATTAHVGAEVVAGRALVLGQPETARALLEPVVTGDPRDPAARIVLAVADERMHDAEALTRALAWKEGITSPLPIDVLLPLLCLVAEAGSLEAARSFMEQVPHEPVAAGDAVTANVAVDLALSGVLHEDELPVDVRIELAARRGAAMPEGVEGADARHRLFAYAVTRPADRRTLDLARHLSGAASTDPLVALSFVRLSLAQGIAPDAATIARLIALGPADSLIAAAALDVAKLRGDVQAIPKARARLIALARTPGERAHALE